MTEGGFVPKDACTGHVMRARARERERTLVIARVKKLFHEKWVPSSRAEI